MLLQVWLAKARLAALLWRAGVWEALQLQRCVVFFVLDGSGRVLAQTTRCLVTNGLIYLGSMALHRYATSRAAAWLLSAYAEPAYGAAAVAAWRRLLDGAFAALWLAPLYVISVGVSSAWYQEIAAGAFEVQRQQQQQQLVAPAAGAAAPQPQQQPQPQRWPPPGPPADASGAVASGGEGAGGMFAALEGAAQELFRLLLFVLFTAEVYVLGLLPFLGLPLNVLFLSWLYSFYCFDYSWALTGARLAGRLAFFEAHWAFFAGFGFPCVAATAFLPFHVGAALANLLFPVFVLVAVASDPLAAERRVLEPGSPDLGSAPVFKLALRPTSWLIRRVFGGFAAGSAARPHAA